MAALGLSLGDLNVKGNHTTPAETVITQVESMMAYEPGPVSIVGKQLGLVTAVKVDGQAVPVLRNTGSEIVINPGYQDPGFAQLELVKPGRTVTGWIEFTPSLRATRNGNLIRVMLNPGEDGFHWLYWSYRRLETPVTFPNVYYSGMLNLNVHGSGILCAAECVEGELLIETVPVPPVLIGEYHHFFGEHPLSGAINLQAYCLLGSDQCFSNMVRVPLATP
jgi:hypothetical protein